MRKKIREDEQTYYICGQCGEKIFYLKTDEPPVPCPECDVNVAPTARYPGTLVGQHGDGVAQSAAATVRSKGWEHKEVDKDDVPDEVKLDITQY